MKKFENLGKKLSKEEQKKIKGGDADEPGCGKYYASCSNDKPCCPAFACMLVGGEQGSMRCD